MCREAGNKRRIAYELRNLGHTARLEGAWEEAVSHYSESLALYQEINVKPGIANLLDSMARLAIAEGQAIRAAHLFGAAEALRESVQALVPGHERHDFERSVAVTRSVLDEEAFAAAWAEGRGMTIEQAIEYALSIE